MQRNHRWLVIGAGLVVASAIGCAQDSGIVLPPEPVLTVSLEPEAIALEAGSTVTINVIVSGGDEEAGTVVDCSGSNNAISVQSAQSSCLVTGVVSGGSATLTVTAQRGLRVGTGSGEVIVFGGHDGASSLGPYLGRRAWSADGREIYRVDWSGQGSGTSFSLEALEVSSEERRRIASVIGGYPSGMDVRSSQDPSSVFFAVRNSEHYSGYDIFHAPLVGGTAHAVARRVGRPRFEVAPSGRRLAYGGLGPDYETIRVLTLSESGPGEEAIFPTAGIAGIKGFSPDGEELVWGDRDGIHMASLRDGSVRLILPPPVDPGRLTHVMAPQVTWEDNVPHLLVAYPREESGGLISDVYDVNGITGARVLFGELPLARAAPRELARSSDGQAFAAWVPVEAVGNAPEPSVYRYRLVVQTHPGGAVRNLLERDIAGAFLVSDWLRWLEFSADGRHLGFAIDEETNVIRVDGE